MKGLPVLVRNTFCVRLLVSIMVIRTHFKDVPEHFSYSSIDYYLDS